MKVIRSEWMGMCFGVREAIKKLEGLENPERVTVYGELVHNKEVLNGILDRGIGIIEESERPSVPETDEVLITAHGISNREKEWLMSKGKSLIDTTCPLVYKVHKAAKSLQDSGYTVIVIGKAGHVEVKGVVGDLDDCVVVGSVGEVRNYGKEKVGIVCQSTFPVEQAAEIVCEIRKMNEESQVTTVDTICKPTKDRQLALGNLLEEVEALVVVGGVNSNNTRQLARYASEAGKIVYHIEKAEDIDSEWFYGVQIVGLTAGTSTLDTTIDKVYEKLVSIGDEIAYSSCEEVLSNV